MTRGTSTPLRAHARLLARAAVAVAACLLVLGAWAGAADARRAVDAHAAGASWHFAPSVSATDRGIILRALGSFEPGIRRLFAEVAPYTTIGAQSGSTSLGGTSGLRQRPYLVIYARAHLHDPAYAPHAVAHELGHVLDDAGVGPRTMRTFLRVVRRSRHYRSCFVMAGGGCTPRRELFADQVAYAATGGRHAPTGYHDPPLLSTSRMVRILSRFTPRP